MAVVGRISRLCGGDGVARDGGEAVIASPFIGPSVLSLPWLRIFGAWCWIWWAW
jgi:hypothetical protein